MLMTGDGSPSNFLIMESHFDYPAAQSPAYFRFNIPMQKAISSATDSAWARQE
jgi:hypothetical protein